MRLEAGNCPVSDELIGVEELEDEVRELKALNLFLLYLLSKE